MSAVHQDLRLIANCGVGLETIESTVLVGSK